MKEFMTLALYLGVLALAAWPLSIWLSPLFAGEAPHPRLARIDRGILVFFGLGKAKGQGSGKRCHNPIL